MNNWNTYAVCKCGFKTIALFGDLFFVKLDCCPKCGAKKPVWVIDVILDNNWKIKTMRFISTAKWYSPKTWGTGHWEIK